LWKFWYINGQPREEINYTTEEDFEIVSSWTMTGEQTVKNGTGIFQTTYDNGNPAAIGEVQNGKKMGIWKKYYPDGGLSEEGYYQDSIYFLSSAWHADGTVMVKNGTGEFVSYFEGTNEVQTKGQFINGLKDGDWVSYYQEPYLLAQEMHFSKG